MTLAYAIGDSLTYGMYASPLTLGYAYVFAASKGWTLNNISFPGRQIGDMFEQAFVLSISKDEKYFVQLASNDTSRDLLETTTWKRLVFAKNVSALAAFLGIPENMKIRAQDVGRVTYSGTWGASGLYGGFWGRYTSENGAKATFSIEGNILYLSYLIDDGATGGQIEIRVDGALKATVNCFGGYGNENTGVTYSQGLARIVGLGLSSHTVELKAIYNGGDVVEWEWAAGLPSSTNRSEAWIGNQHKISGGNCPNVNAVILAAVTELHGDGLHIYHADTNTACLYPGDYYDSVHLNTGGHSHMASAFIAALTDVLPIPMEVEVMSGTITIGFKALENIGTWGIEIDLAELFDQTPPDGDSVNFLLKQQTSMPAWDMVNFGLGSGLAFPEYVLRTDWIHEAIGNVFDCAVSLSDLTTLINPDTYTPPSGDTVNFYPQEQAAMGDAYPVAYDEINWFWPLHFIGDLESVGDLGGWVGALELITEQNLGVTLVSLAGEFLEPLVSIDASADVTLFVLSQTVGSVALITEAIMALSMVDLDLVFLDLVLEALGINRGTKVVRTYEYYDVADGREGFKPRPAGEHELGEVIDKYTLGEVK